MADPSYFEQAVTDTVLMIRPVLFGFNRQTAATNIFQLYGKADPSAIQQAAHREFDKFVFLLKQAGIDVIVVDDTTEPHTPDSIFPNNWLSTHHHGMMVMYPMLAPNRRLERRSDILDLLNSRFHFRNILDLSYFEQQKKFLEGTGSLVLDRRNKIAYAAISPRTDIDALNEFCHELHYRPVTFTTRVMNGIPVYHTNVVMAIGTVTAVVCTSAFEFPDQAETILDELDAGGYEVIDLSEKQMLSFAGNMLLVKNKSGEKFWVMSERAFESLGEKQKEALNADGGFLFSPLETIEHYGGGSARCMMLEIFYPGMKMEF